ncbi:MAG: zinc ribbon domain-containing protein [Deltaproteobacteria bacterium]|nr:zinc ribbon domain-containing protein [Deltaproteobacteria bacterium]
MPVYEFYCPDCHMIFNFFSRRVNTTKRPSCPRCRRPKLERRVSIFSISKGRKESDGEDPFAGMDEEKLERAVESLAGEAGNLNEDDPRQVAGLMRKLYEKTGLKLGSGMEEALRRLESGEDPETVENELGDVLEEEGDLFTMDNMKGGLKGIRKRLPPGTDDKLYDL